MARDRRYVIPFPNGITVPTEEYTVAAKDKKIAFPVSYQDTIMSTLKVLARPETYQSESVAELNFSVQQGMDILAGIEDNDDCTLQQSTSILNVVVGNTWADAMFTGIPQNNVSRYAFCGISYTQDGEPGVNTPRFYITSPGWVNPGCTWDITFQTRVPGRVYNLTHQECGQNTQVDTYVMQGQFATHHFTNNRLIYLDIDVCDIVFGLIDIANPTCGDV